MRDSDLQRFAGIYLTHPLLMPTVAIAVGIFMARFTPVPLWGLAVIYIVSLVAAFFGRRYTAVTVAMVVLGYVNADMALPSPLPDGLNHLNVTIVGEIDKCTRGANANRYIVDVIQCSDSKTGDKFDEHFKVLLSDNGNTAYTPGDIICANGMLRKADEADIVPDAVNYNKYLYMQGANATLWLPGNDIELLQKADSGFDDVVADARDGVTDVIINSGVSGNTAAFLTAVIVGDDSYLHPDTDEAFRTSGLAHLLALSGLHVGIIILLITACLSWIKMLRHGYYTFYVFLIVATGAYAVFAGMTPSVVRAASMAVILFVTTMLQRRANVYNGICFAVLLWLVVNPLWLFSPGFQMSVFAVLGIVLAIRATGTYHIDGRYKRVLQFLIVPIAAMAATAIPAMVYFNTFPLYFLPANIIASLIISPLMICGVALIFASVLAIPHGALSWVTDRLYGLIESTASLFGGNDAVLHTYPSGITILCCAAAVIAFFTLLWRPKRIRRIALFVLTIILIVASSTFDPSRKSVDAYILADNNATEILMADTDSVYLITDAGGIDADNNLVTLQQRYQNLMIHRQCHPKIVPLSGEFSRRNFSRRGDVLLSHNRSILLAFGDTITHNKMRCNYALIGRNFSGNIDSIAQYADTILLGSSLRPQLRTAYSQRLDTIGKPYRDIRRDGGIAIHIAHN